MNATETVQFLIQFPRLRSIDCPNVGALELFLPVLEQLTNVVSLDLALSGDMQLDSGERYLSTRPQQVRDQLIERLSNITDFIISPYTNIGNVLQFVSEYFTGLNYLYVERAVYERAANEEQEDLFHRNLFSLIPSVNSCVFYLENMHFRSLVNNFATLIQNVFQKVPATYKQSKSRLLVMEVNNKNIGPSHLVTMKLRTGQTPFTRNLYMVIDQKLPVIFNLFKNGAPMDEVDVFILHFPIRSFHRSRAVATYNYLQFLETMPALKVVELDVPSCFDQTIPKLNQPYSGPILSRVEEVTFNVSVDGTIQTLLDCCYFSFPNLKLLIINGFSGMWNTSIGEFLLFLQNYSLEQLTLDMDPVLKKMKHHLNTKNTFFVLEIEIQNLWQKRLYKVSTNFSYDEMINTHELRNFLRRKDYLSVRLVVNSLKKLQLYRKGYGEENSCINMLEDKE